MFSLPGCRPPQAYDPVTADLVPFDVDHPPLIAETIFRVEDADLNAIVYEAQGPGPHPTVVLLHGFPGNEKNLDLAQAVRRAGWNVVFFHYRGSWGSGGRFSFVHVLEDVVAVVDAISQPEFAREHRIDPERLALIGHSMGGFAALVSGAEIEQVDCVVSMAGANLGGLAKSVSASPEASVAFAASLDGWSGPIRGRSGAELVEEIAVNLERFDTTTHVASLSKKDLLLIAGRLDRVTPVALHHDPLVEALTVEAGGALQTTVFEQADHAFSGQRIALAQRVTSFLEADCSASPTAITDQPDR